MKIQRILPLLIVVLVSLACSTNSDETIKQNVPGELIWGGEPASDGTGVLFKTEQVTYGVEGNRNDFITYFGESNAVRLKADFVVTGDTTVRNWGIKFPLIEFINLHEIDE